MKATTVHVVEPLVLDIDSVLAKHDPDHRIREFYPALMAENAKVNLVSRETTESDFLKLCAESLLPFETDIVTQKTFTNYLDIGAGGGLPSIPILIGRKIPGKAILYERTQKKAAALGRIVDALKLNAHVLALSFGETQRPDRFSLVTMRYVALTDKLLRDIFRILSPGGIFIYYGRPEIKSTTCPMTVYPYLIPPDTATRHFTVIQSK